MDTTGSDRLSDLDFDLDLDLKADISDDPDDSKNSKNLEDSEKRQHTSRKKSSSRRRKKRRKSFRTDAGRFMIAKLLVLVCFVLVLFEGNIISKLFSHKVGSSVAIVESANSAETEGSFQASASPGAAGSTGEVAAASGGDSSAVSLTSGALAGGGVSDQTAETTASATPGVQPLSSETINSPKVVPAQSTPVDDSYFSDAVFIGDSRMEGFRNSSGITQGTFLTSVGLAINDMDKQIISSSEGDISVYQGLSGRQYKKIYLMLGANDLGYYPWDAFLPTFKSVLEKFHILQPHAIIYVCSVIYVDESKIAAGFEYDNNDNVRTINGYILEACEELWYSYYLNLNEIFSDGYGQLISDASPDGIHLYPDYLVMMLDYLKSHYITDEAFAAETAAHPDDVANVDLEDETDQEDNSGGDKKKDSSDEDSDQSAEEDVSAS